VVVIKTIATAITATAVVAVNAMIVLSVQPKVQQVLKVEMRHEKQVQVEVVKTAATAMAITAIATRTTKIQSQRIKLR
jgi:hypothetical protein